MSRFLSTGLAALIPYTPGEQPDTHRWIKLNTNENPYPPSPKVAEALATLYGEQGGDGEKKYPDPITWDGVKAIAGYYGLDETMVIMGNGSDEILAFSYMAYGEKIVFPEISYGFYPVFAQLFQCSSRAVPLTKKFKIRPEDYYNAEGTVLIANPNAPTGRALPLEDIEGILRNNRDNVVIIDEAYIDFGGESCVPLIKRYDNLLVVQTFSKSRSLAGMRIGMAMGNRQMIEDLNRIKFSFNPYNLSRSAILAAKISIEDKLYFREITRRIIGTRNTFASAMRDLGCHVIPSEANFVLVNEGAAYHEFLRERGILVRYFGKGTLVDYVRITIGTPEDMEKVIEATFEWKKERREGEVK